MSGARCGREGEARGANGGRPEGAKRSNAVFGAVRIAHLFARLASSGREKARSRAGSLRLSGTYLP